MTPHIDDLPRALLEWFDGARRDMPWRRDRDPYRVWVSEVMLQQTRVEAVVPYFERWMRRFPDLDALAGADVDEVLAEWEGLGYYSRARNLHAAARIVRDDMDGAIPDTRDGLKALPGVGDYTSGAVASIAFGRQEPAVDGNARRVLSRLFDVAAPTPAAVRERAASLMPAVRPGDFNQALMELGATICKLRAPRCAECPVAPWCLALARGTVAERPGRSRRPAVPTFDVGVAVAVSPGGRALLVRRAEDGMLGGLWEFPGRVAEGEPAAAAARALAPLAPGARLARPLATVDHLYSHRRHLYHAFLFESPDAAAPDAAAIAEGGWTAATWERPDPPGRALPAAQRRIARAAARLAPC
ncbi:MAG TPA: A/G-specific adenine glycosylase [Gemmatimonadota bacterium]|nr:A/G-specific adenine glycosylase [Gemmatimonadota bacterium]